MLAARIVRAPHAERAGDLRRLGRALRRRAHADADERGRGRPVERGAQPRRGIAARSRRPRARARGRRSSCPPRATGAVAFARNAAAIRSRRAASCAMPSRAGRMSTSTAPISLPSPMSGCLARADVPRAGRSSSSWISMPGGHTLASRSRTSSAASSTRSRPRGCLPRAQPARRVLEIDVEQLAEARHAEAERRTERDARLRREPARHRERQVGAAEAAREQPHEIEVAEERRAADLREPDPVRRVRQARAVVAVRAARARRARSRGRVTRAPAGDRRPPPGYRRRAPKRRRSSPPASTTPSRARRAVRLAPSTRSATSRSSRIFDRSQATPQS